MNRSAGVMMYRTPHPAALARSRKRSRARLAANAKAMAESAQPLARQGRPSGDERKGSDTTIDRGAPYLTRRIARDLFWFAVGTFVGAGVMEVIHVLF